MNLTNKLVDLYKKTRAFAESLESADVQEVHAFAKEMAEQHIPLLFISLILQGAEVNRWYAATGNAVMARAFLSEKLPASRVPVVYIAGPYSAPCARITELNVRAAEDAAYEMYRSGIAPVCPHTTTRWEDNQVSYGFMCDATSATMLRCDAVYALPHWQESKGARAEVALAEKVGIPVFYAMHLLRDWAKSLPISARA